MTSLKKEFAARAAHFVAKGTAYDNYKYSTKEGKFFEKGVMSVQGKVKCDLVAACQDMGAGMSTSDMLEKHGAGFVINKRKITEMAAEIKHDEVKKRRMAKSAALVLRPWQTEVLAKLETQNDRQIMFVMDPEGGQGKKTLAKYMMSTMDAIRFDNGKSNDIKYMHKGQSYVIFDLCRSSQEHINYEILESIKNGVFCSYKYESSMRMYDNPKMLVLMNEGPDMTKLSQDRYVLYAMPSPYVWPALPVAEPLVQPANPEVIDIEDPDVMAALAAAEADIVANVDDGFVEF